jgi:hypothetical protein
MTHHRRKCNTNVAAGVYRGFIGEEIAGEISGNFYPRVATD